MLFSFCIANVLQEVNKLMGTLPPAIQALTGVDLTGVRILSSSFLPFLNDMSSIVPLTPSLMVDQTQKMPEQPLWSKDLVWYRATN